MKEQDINNMTVNQLGKYIDHILEQVDTLRNLHRKAVLEINKREEALKASKFAEAEAKIASCEAQTAKYKELLAKHKEMQEQIDKAKEDAKNA